MVSSNLLSAHELAKELNLSVETIWRYTREKTIPVVELGFRQYRYRLADVLSTLSGAVRERSEEYQESPLKKLTYDDYCALPEEPGLRCEVFDGVLVKEPSPSWQHQRVSRRLQRILEDYFWAIDPTGEVVDAPLDLTLGQYTVVQPDLFYVSSQQKEIIKPERVDGTPALVVEILSPSTGRKDRLQKMRLYQRAGVEHYWLVDPEGKMFESYQLTNSIYALVASGMDDEELEHPAFAGLKIPLSALW